MTITEPALPPGAEPADWYTIDYDGLPTSTGRTVHTPNLTPYPSAPDVRVECVQHPDGSYDPNSLVVRVGGEEFSGDDVRKIARSLNQAADVFDQWSVVTETPVAPVEENTGRRIRNILDVIPANEWTPDEALVILHALEEIVRDRVTP